MATNRRQQIQLSPDEQAAFFRERKKAALATIDQDGFPHVVAMNSRRSSTSAAIPRWP
jgi:hypothetical protein